MEESYKNKSYNELYEIIKNEFKYKECIYGGIKAVFCTSEDNFNLVKHFFRCANSPCCWHYGLTKVSGYYSGPDWYFCEHQDFDYGMGAKSTTYWMESLSDKKREFENFCSEYK